VLIFRQILTDNKEVEKFFVVDHVILHSLSRLGIRYRESQSHIFTGPRSLRFRCHDELVLATHRRFHFTEGHAAPGT
jgi:hypothetical protein